MNEYYLCLNIVQRVSVYYVQGEIKKVKKYKYYKRQKFEVLAFLLAHRVLLNVFSLVVACIVVVALVGGTFSNLHANTLDQESLVGLTYNEEAIEVNYGDDSAVKDIILEILKNVNHSIYDIKPITLKDGSFGYESGDFIVSLDKIPSRALTEDKIVLSFQRKDVYYKEDFLKHVIKNEKDLETLSIHNNMVVKYLIKVKYVDTQPPVITLKSNTITVSDHDIVDVDSFVESIVDNYDGMLSTYTIEQELPKTAHGLLVVGDQMIVVQATDSNGNIGRSQINVHVNPVQAPLTYQYTYDINTHIQQHDGSVSSIIYQNAMQQLGTNQDCTMLVTNALSSAGIYHHGWPASYLSLGNVVSIAEAQPGDLVYYANGGLGVAHVAVYAGNGQAVHGGWKGYQTLISSVDQGSGPVFIHVGQ